MKHRKTYFCPVCTAALSIDNNVVLTVVKKNGEGGIIFLDSKLGDYTKVKHTSLEIKDGEILKLYCPVCHKDLLCMPDYNLARLIMKDEHGENLTVLFSVVYGKEVTVIIKDKKVENKYGKHRSEVDFESLSLCK